MVSSLDLKALNVFLQTPVSQDMVHKLVVTTLQVIPCQDDKTSKSAAGGTRALPSLLTFINKLVRYTNVYTGTLMTTLVLLDRLKLKLPKNAQGLACTRHRIFLSCLILSSKFHNDSSPKNVHWAKYTDGLFSLNDVNLMERQLLFLLNWNIKVTNEEMVEQLAKFLAPIKENLIQTAKVKRFLQTQQQVSLSRLQAQANAQAEQDLLRPSSPRSHMSRSSSSASSLSLGQRSPMSRHNSTASSYHTRQSSCSSVESLSPSSHHKLWSGSRVDPEIEMAARTEERELTRMLSTFGNFQVN